MTCLPYIIRLIIRIRLSSLSSNKKVSREQEISINAPELIDLQADRYNSNPIQFRYNITTVITVTSDKVELVRNLIKEQSELLKQGIAITGGDYRYNVQYDFTGLNAVKPQMIEEATKNARAAAIKFAKDSDSELGKIKELIKDNSASKTAMPILLISNEYAW